MSKPPIDQEKYKSSAAQENQLDEMQDVEDMKEEEQENPILKKSQENYKKEVLRYINNGPYRIKNLEDKCLLLDVEDADLRNVFIKNGNGKEVGLLKEEFETLNKKYAQKLKDLGFKSGKDWKGVDKSSESDFVLNEIKTIRDTLGVKLKINQLSSKSREAEEVNVKLNWFRSDANAQGLNEVKAKIANDEWHKRSTPSDEVNILRSKFRELFEGLKDRPEEKQRVFDEEKSWLGDEKTVDNFLEGYQLRDFSSTDVGKEYIQSLFDEMVQELEQKKKALEVEYNEKLEEAIELVTQVNIVRKAPIVWTVPGKVELKDGEEIADYVYGSKKPDKVVHKPLFKIHKSLIDANWAIRNGGVYKANYLTAHLLFVVSNSPHKVNGEETYEGGRDYIDFPVVVPAIIEGNPYVRQEDMGKSTVAGRGQHSERALVRFFNDEDNVKFIVGIIKDKLQKKFDSSEGHKVYEVNLFLNSNKNVCNQYGDDANCEEILRKLQSPHESTFLKEFKKELEAQGLKSLTRSNDQFPRMVINVSSFEYFSGYCSDRLWEDASKTLQSGRPDYEESLNGIRIDTKPLAGEVVLSASELSIDPDFEYRESFGSRKEYSEARKSRARDIVLKEEGVPAYSGFCSATGREDFLQNAAKKRKYQNPPSFDGAETRFPEQSIDESASGSEEGKDASSPTKRRRPDSSPEPESAARKSPEVKSKSAAGD